MLLLAFLLTFFSFAALDKGVINIFVNAVVAVKSTLVAQYEYYKNISDTSDKFILASEAYFRSIILLLSGITIGSFLGFVLGIISGINPNSKFAGISSYFSFAGIFVPSFLLALLILIIFVRYVGPTTGIRFVLINPMVDIFDPRRLLAPSLVLAVRPMAFITQITIGALSEIVQKDYIRTARAKGLKSTVILFRHILPNIALPCLTAINSSIFFSLSSLIVVEWLFAWNGVGYMLLDSVDKRDAVLTTYLLIFIGSSFMILNYLIKLLMIHLDPRSTGFN